MCAQQQQQNRSEQNQPVSRSICRRRRDQKERKSPAHSLSNPFRFYFSSFSLSLSVASPNVIPPLLFFLLLLMMLFSPPPFHYGGRRQTDRPPDRRTHTLNYKCVSLQFHSFYFYSFLLLLFIYGHFFWVHCALFLLLTVCVCVCLEGLFSGPLCF